MEFKKTQPAQTETTISTEKRSQKVRDFIGDIKAEIFRISWTSKEELIVYTKIVVATTFMMGIGIYFIDLFIQGFLNGLATLIRLISG